MLIEVSELEYKVFLRKSMKAVSVECVGVDLVVRLLGTQRVIAHLVYFRGTGYRYYIDKDTSSTTSELVAPYDFDD